jgi:hypothetical protein
MITPRERLGATVVSSPAPVGYGLTTGTAADFGALYSIKPLPILKLSLLASNGTGHKAPELNMHKKLSAALNVTPMPGIISEIYIDNEAGYGHTNQSGEVELLSRTSYGVLLAYQLEYLSIALDYFEKEYPDKAVSPSGEKIIPVSNVVSIFGHYQAMEKLRLLGRFDAYTPVADKDYLEGDYNGKCGESLLIVGADCSYGPPNTHFILTLQNIAYDLKTLTGSGSWKSIDPYSLIALDITIGF